MLRHAGYYRDVYDHLVASTSDRRPARHRDDRDQVNVAMITFGETE
jgi:hypothetical protein